MASLKQLNGNDHMCANSCVDELVVSVRKDQWVLDLPRKLVQVLMGFAWYEEWYQGIP